MSRILKIYFEKHPERLKEYNESKERYKNGESLTRIAKTNVYIKNRKELSKLFKEDNITIKMNGQKYKYNESAFSEINTEESAYWLGYLYADGNVNELRNCFDLSVSEKDYEHLIKFKNYISEDLQLIKRKSHLSSTNKEYYSYRCYVVNKTITENLLKYNCNWSKTYDVEFPNFISKELMPHFIRGYFDGDGCISLTSQSRLSFTSASKEFLIMLQNYLKDNLSINKNKLYQDKRRQSTYSIQWGSKNDIQKFFNYIYKDATIFLKRKHDIYIELLGRLKTKPLKS